VQCCSGRKDQTVSRLVDETGFAKSVQRIERRNLVAVLLANDLVY